MSLVDALVLLLLICDVIVVVVFDASRCVIDRQRELEVKII